MGKRNAGIEYDDLLEKFGGDTNTEDTEITNDGKSHHYSDRFVKGYRIIGFIMMMIALGVGLMVGFSLGGGNFMGIGSILIALLGTVGVSLVWFVGGSRKGLKKNLGSRADKKIAKLQKQKEKSLQKQHG